MFVLKFDNIKLQKNLDKLKNLKKNQDYNINMQIWMFTI